MRDREIDTQMQVSLLGTVIEACLGASGYTGHMETESMNCSGAEMVELELGFED